MLTGQRLTVARVAVLPELTSCFISIPSAIPARLLNFFFEEIDLLTLKSMEMQKPR